MLGEEQISLSSSAFVSDAIFFMKRNNIRRIVVRDNQETYGVFTVDEALHHILEGTVDIKLIEARKKKPIAEEDFDLKRIVSRMVKENSDFVLVDKKIVTEKDVVKSFDWDLVDEVVSSISNEGIVIPPYTRLFTAIEIMVKKGVRHLVIGEKEPMGVLSARDVVFSYGEIGLNAETSSFIQPSLVSVSGDMKLREAVKIMLSRNVGAVVVREDQVKLFTLRDLIKVISKHM
ncbi:hypothetical protein IC006_1391 [Sulfuracidifex tepidarius]|uniref:CBS domain-containing protein n=1 Tax=Sulfuracidifex tepidarius TaxID=1294262 RepID=A0A510DVN2_9CREN|nr:CBS domain-containing protein [Sulfuracidifex tepidarius]BBG24090.1 hypothetical protein IC006_1391 [Sulfuracidifex tepidarius]